MRGRRPLRATFMAAVVLAAGLGCSSYDSQLLDAPDAVVPMMLPPDAGTAHDQHDTGTAIPDAGAHEPDTSVPMPDAGHMPDAQVDAGKPDAGPAADAGGAMPDAAADASTADAGCGAGAGEVDCCPDDPNK